ncbi:MAG: hypothetical protein MUQ56_08795 [Thermoleophilia bacterium]|nr:hypothetical protein [Thermoleophilia bacterium]
MPTDTTGMNEDRALIESMADAIADGGAINFATPEDRAWAVKQLRGIAIGCDQLATHNRRVLLLEERVDQMLCERLERWIKDNADLRGDPLPLVAATWLLSRRTKNAAMTQAIGSAAGGLGNLLSCFGSKKPKETP